MKQINATRITPETSTETRGLRVLVDAVWPDGLRRECVDRWIPELAPSDWLLDRFGRDRIRWGTFRSRYRRQLASLKRRQLLTEIHQLSATHQVTLLTAAPTGTVNHARIIAEALANGRHSGV